MKKPMRHSGAGRMKDRGCRVVQLWIQPWLEKRVREFDPGERALGRIIKRLLFKLATGREPKKPLPLPWDGQ
jgi:hypothetical protein